MTWDGEAYQRRFDDLAAEGRDVHGEAAFVMARSPAAVLDAGCGTGRVAIELARRGARVVAVDRDPSMLATARRRGPAGPGGHQLGPAGPGGHQLGPAGPKPGCEVVWVESDLAALDLGQLFDVVVMAGNVLLFTAPGTEAAVVAGCARHLASDGALVAGFELGRSYDLAAYDAHCADAGLALAERWATWDRDPFTPGSGYAVSVHRRVRPG